MCPPPSAAGRPPGKGTPTLEIWRFRQWYADELKARGRSLRYAARKLGYKHNASRISEYLNGKRVPGSEMVRRMAEAIGASPLAALWIAGYREALLDELAALYRLGWMWCREDGVVPGSGIGVAPTDDNRLLDRYHRATIYQTSEGAHPIATEVVVPWPWALAIFIAVGIFPRRGDIPVSDLLGRLSKLATLAGPLVRMARGLDMPDNFVESDLLDTAASIIPKVYLGLSGSAIVDEYINLWADQASREYSAYVRLVLFTEIGCIGFDENHGRHWLEDGKRAEFPSEEELNAITRAANYKH
jgi:transcriptional regulator with XRE-family HTH domain